ncbi:MAG: cation transporter [Parasporobacterium sp.]|nr:cation transporter [Parasporobacterium sp.]
MGTDMENRDKVVVRTSILGIIANVFLAAFKAAIGILSNSIAVILDSVNNLSDALSSVITIIGTKLANRKPDRKHPLGHGRVEYLSALIVSAIVLYAGITSAVESIKNIFNPQVPDYSVISLVIIAVAVAVKILLGIFVKKQGEKVHSTALKASGSDALFDAILSFSVLVCAILYMVLHVSLEAYVGLVISAFIIKSGLEMMKETLDDILGHRADPEMTKEIKSIINEEPEVRGAYDLFLNNYGPNREYASVHIEVPDVMRVSELDLLTRKIQQNVYLKTGVILTGIGVYSYNTTDDEAAKIRNKVQNIVLSYDWALQLHGFYVNIEEKSMRYDVVVSFDIEPKDAVKILYEEMNVHFPGYKCVITTDLDITD